MWQRNTGESTPQSFEWVFFGGPSGLLVINSPVRASRDNCLGRRFENINDHAMRLLSIWIIVLAFGLCAGSSAEPPAVRTEADSGHAVALRTGQELVLTLNSNHSTGYSWIRADAETPVLVTLGKPEYKSGGPLPGASGVEIWKFRAARRGAQTLELEYRRPWEKHTQPAKTMILHVTIQ
jgi:predicted secreted protein